MRRREFIAALGSAVAWPVAGRAQQGDRLRRIGVLMVGDENDPAAKSQLSALTRALADLGWTDGRNVRTDVRWAGGHPNRTRAFAQELVGLQPDILVGAAGTSTAALQRETRTIPIVFANVGDPVGTGFVAALNQPGGNITGFGFLELSIVGKSLELLWEIAPGLKRAAIMFNPDTARSVSTYVPIFGPGQSGGVPGAPGAWPVGSGRPASASSSMCRKAKPALPRAGKVPHIPWFKLSYGWPDRYRAAPRARAAVSRLR
jgi:putative ABC transport system substrate-binding protein